MQAKGRNDSETSSIPKSTCVCVESKVGFFAHYTVVRNRHSRIPRCIKNKLFNFLFLLFHVPTPVVLRPACVNLPHNLFSPSNGVRNHCWSSLRGLSRSRPIFSISPEAAITHSKLIAGTSLSLLSSTYPERYSAEGLTMPSRWHTR